MSDPNLSLPISRRTILAGGAVLGATLIAAACGSSSESAGDGNATTASTAPASTTAPADPSAVNGKVAALAAGLEVLAVGTYKAALDAAEKGKLGKVPPAVAEFVTTAMGQHRKHLAAWNKVIVAGGGSAVTTPNATLKPSVDAAFAKVTDVTGAAKLALLLEQTASATYLSAQDVLTDKDAIKLAGSIQIIDAQHAAILLYVLGKYPVPDVFAKTDLAVAA